MAPPAHLATDCMGRGQSAGQGRRPLLSAPGFLSGSAAFSALKRVTWIQLSSTDSDGRMGGNQDHAIHADGPPSCQPPGEGRGRRRFGEPGIAHRQHLTARGACLSQEPLCLLTSPNNCRDAQYSSPRPQSPPPILKACLSDGCTYLSCFHSS